MHFEEVEPWENSVHAARRTVLNRFENLVEIEEIGSTERRSRRASTAAEGASGELCERFIAQTVGVAALCRVMQAVS